MSSWIGEGAGPPDMWSNIVGTGHSYDDTLAQVLQANHGKNLAGAQQAQQPTILGITPPPAMGGLAAVSGNRSEIFSKRAREMFLKRMGGLRGELQLAPGHYISCHFNTNNERVYLFYCFDDKAGVVDESMDMFPSDQLITQFRMILA